jgi:hypothetical protein
MSRILIIFARWIVGKLMGIPGVTADYTQEYHGIGMKCLIDEAGLIVGLIVTNGDDEDVSWLELYDDTDDESPSNLLLMLYIGPGQSIIIDRPQKFGLYFSTGIVANIGGDFVTLHLTTCKEFIK